MADAGQLRNRVTGGADAVRSSVRPASLSRPYRQVRWERAPAQKPGRRSRKRTVQSQEGELETSVTRFPINTLGRRRAPQYLTADVRTQPGSNPQDSSENKRKRASSTSQVRRWRRCRPGCTQRPASVASPSGSASLPWWRQAWPCWSRCRTCTTAPDIPARGRRPPRRRRRCETTGGRSDRARDRRSG
jgi:hypothetical protein